MSTYRTSAEYRRLNPQLAVPTVRVMSVGSGVRSAGEALDAFNDPAVVDDPQEVLLAGLIACMTKDTPSVQHVLDLIEPHLHQVAGLSAAAVFELDAETGQLNATARLGVASGQETITVGKVLREAAGAAPLVDGERMAVRLRIGGQTVGVLLLIGSALAALRHATLATIALHVATTLQGLAAEKQRQFLSHVSGTIRRLFEQGMAATSVEAAGQVLAASAAEAFRTELGALFLMDAEGIVRYVHGVGFPEGDARLRFMVGQPATTSAVWQAINGGIPALVNDTSTTRLAPSEGLVRQMRLKSYIALPMLSADGAIGMIVCGDAGGTREWTSQDRTLAEQLSVEGALIVDSAGMRQAAQAHVAQLSHQAYHDSLTGLPNRSFLLQRVEMAVKHAADTGTRTALLALDLNGFKKVNDTAGHLAGDILLQQVAKRLLSAVRDCDVVSRIGGDEFAILLTRDPDEDVVVGVGTRIVERLREPFMIDGEQWRIGGSVGIALYPDDADECDGLMRDADAAMYAAKRDTKTLGGGYRRAGLMSGVDTAASTQQRLEPEVAPDPSP